MPPALKVPLAWGANAVLVVGAFALVRRRRRVSPRLLAWLPIWIPVGASFAAAVLLIRPRDHYLVPLCFSRTRRSPRRAGRSRDGRAAARRS
ncbi:Hypothetical protein A7982_03984 [Minicystis rosea]|nr:Hypothetical protein A7982_03984 [Minicystis rosea]